MPELPCRFDFSYTVVVLIDRSLMNEEKIDSANARVIFLDTKVEIWAFSCFVRSHDQKNEHLVSIFTSECARYDTIRFIIATTMDLYQAAVEEANRSAATWLDLLHVKANFKALMYTCVLVTGQQLSGINVVLLYSETIFRSASDPDGGLDPSISTIIVGVVQLLASCVTPLVVDRLGRRLLLVISGVGEVTSLVSHDYS